MQLVDNSLGYKVDSSVKTGGKLVEILQTVMFALAVSIFVYLFLAIPNQVEGKSMYPNLDTSQILLTNKFLQIAGGDGHVIPNYDYRRGDMVVFQQPGNPDLVKRVVGLPGERVKIRDGQVLVEGNVLVEEYLPAGTRTAGGAFLPEGVEKRIPNDSYMVLGDNRNNSRDSRTVEVGFVQRKYLKGSPFLRVLPLNEFGILPRGEYRQVPESEFFEEN